MGKLIQKPSFDEVYARVERELYQHPVILNNRYTEEYREGYATSCDVENLFWQFGVFSKWFIKSQTIYMLNARNMDVEKVAREILVSEIGVATDKYGSPEGKCFSKDQAHINWLRKTIEPLGIDPIRLGAKDTAWPSTLELLRAFEISYESPQWWRAFGASTGIEPWAAYGIGRGEFDLKNFWKCLIIGTDLHNKRVRVPKGLDVIPLDFFEGHYNLEKGHEHAVKEALREAYEDPDFDCDQVIEGGLIALDGMKTFWDGLYERREWRL